MRRCHIWPRSYAYYVQFDCLDHILRHTLSCFLYTSLLLASGQQTMQFLDFFLEFAFLLCRFITHLIVIPGNYTFHPFPSLLYRSRLTSCSQIRPPICKTKQRVLNHEQLIELYKSGLWLNMHILRFMSHSR
jgi:hypothetical protein